MDIRMKVMHALSAAALLIAVTASPVQAVTLTLSGPIANPIQQTAQTPSIFAGATPTQPAGFGYEKFPSGGTNVTYDATTGTGAVDWNKSGTSGADYTVGQITTALGGNTSFNVGIDVNTTNANSEVLEHFEVLVDTGSGFTSEFSFNTPSPIAPPAANGTGWSDFMLSTVDLSAFAATDSVQFHVIISGAVDGQEQLFLTAVPVPAAVWLFGSGLLGLAGIARRKKQ